MNTEALFLFLILLLGLVLCSFLGGNCGKEGLTGNFTANFNLTGNGNRSGSNNGTNGSYTSSSGASTTSSNQYDNYNHYTGTSTQLSSGSTFYGQNGTTAVVVANSDGSQSLQIILPSNSSPITFTQSHDNSNNSVESYTNYYGNKHQATVFNGPNGSTATVVTGNNGQTAIKVTTQNGVYFYHTSGHTSGHTFGNSNLTDTSTQYYGSTGVHIQPAPTSLAYTGSNAGAITGPHGNTAYYAEGPAGNAVVGTTNSSQNYEPYGGSVGSVSGPYGNTAYYAQGPAGNTVAGINYNSALPPGIPRSQIPPGDEDLYILKSEVVPPVCPACPSSSVCPRQEPCPPCPACARCPEPSFECKKVPNYSAINNDYLPSPVLNDFSTFGM